MADSRKTKAEKSLRASWVEGIPAAVMLGIIDNYFIPYALFLGASTHQIGFLVALPHLAGSYMQLYAADIVRYSGSRRKFLMVGVFSQALLLLPFAALVYFKQPWQLIVFGFLLALYRVIGNSIGTAWGSLVSDYFAPDKRGDYFGWRAQITGIAGLLGIILSGIFLSRMKSIDPQLGFFLLFAIAASFRFLSSALIAGLVDLPMPHDPKNTFTFYKFLRRFRESNFVKFVLYVSGITFASNLAGPYFSVYMLRDLHFNYVNYAAVQFASVVASLVAFPIWGRHADLVGNAKILKITSLLVPWIPILWLFTKQPVLLVLIEAVSGVIWGGFNLCVTNFIYDAVTPEKRVRCIGYFNLLNGGALFLGSSLGGYLADKLPKLNGFPILTLFAISGFLRWVVHFFLSPNFKEVRQASHHHVSSFELFSSMLGITPLVQARGLNLFPSMKWQRDFDSEWLLKRLQESEKEK